MADTNIKTVEERPLKPLAYLFILGILIFAGVYFLKTEDVPVAKNIITVSNTKFSEKRVEYNAIPTKLTQPDTVYRIIIDNGIWHWSYKVSWNQLELNIKKPQLIKDNISSDEYSAILQSSHFNSTIYKVTKERNALWVFLSILFFIAIIPVTTYKTYKYYKMHTMAKELISNATSPTNLKVAPTECPPPPKLPGETISRLLHLALLSIDATTKWYTDENEATRELVGALNLLFKTRGIENEAVYQKSLTPNRRVDVRIGNILIEGKLSPPQTEVDRLIGQLTEYVKYSNEIHIVIYGSLSNEAKQRILNEINQRYYGIVFLDYLEYPTRQRK